MFKKYMQDLALLCLDDCDTFQTQATRGFKCICSTAIYSNRVFIEKDFDISELTYAKNYYNPNPYTLWVDSKNIAMKNKLVGEAYHFCNSFPMMVLDLKKFTPTDCDKRIKIRELKFDKEIINTMIPAIVKAYNPHVSDDVFKKYLGDWHILFNYLKHSNSYDNMHFFLGCWDDVPAATGIFIVKDGNVYLYWIGSIFDYRCKGLGCAITSIPLYHFKKEGIQKAFLFASPMGERLYAKIGFAAVGQIDIYKTLL